MKKTRNKIIAVATQAFNERGFGNVNLKELSEIIGISRGNLAYHFKNKEILLLQIVDDMWASISEEMNKTLEVPSFENLHNRVQIYFKYQKRFAFIFLDPHVQIHPVVHEKLQSMVNDTIDNYNKMIALGINMGTIKEEQNPGTYHSLVHAIWMITFYRFSGIRAQFIKMEDDAEQLIWGLIWPHLTEKGQQRFKDYFGSDYHLKMGPTFNVTKHEFITF